MRLHIIPLAAAAVLALAGTAQAGEPLIPSDKLITVRLLADDGNQIDVLTDNRPAHWRRWTIEALLPLNREDRCRARFDARRTLIGRPVTQGVPNRCNTHPNRKPDVWPG